MLEIIRRVVGQEIAQVRSSALGVVTAVFPHSASDDEHNYEASVRLKHSELTLPKVPIAVAQIGFAATPQVGDLVLVQFIDGDLSQPVIAGRLYHDEARPPLHAADELVLERRLGDGTLSQLRFAADGAIHLQREVDPEDGYTARATVRITKDGAVEIRAGEKTHILLSNDGAIEILADGQAISITCSELSIEGNVSVKGDLKVEDAAGKSTTVQGNQIQGA